MLNFITATVYGLFDSYDLGYAGSFLRSTNNKQLPAGQSIYVLQFLSLDSGF